MTSKEVEELAFEVLPILRQARQAILAVYDSGQVISSEKADKTPVTNADRASHDLLVKKLGNLTPRIPVISEEAVTKTAAETGVYFWLVDPLDGTKEFLRRSGEFTINVALVDGTGKPVLGLLDVPAQRKTYIGSEMGARCHDSDGRRISLRVRRVEPGEDLTVALSRSHQGMAEDWLKAHQVPIKRVVYAGSALKFCWIAEGRVDLYVRLKPTMGWDTAAGQALLESAGGSLVTLQQKPLRYLPGAFVNPHFLALGGGTGPT